MSDTFEDPSVHRRRAALRRLIEADGRPLCRLAQAAGVSPSGPRHFLAGRSHSLNTRTEEALAAALGITVAELRGDDLAAADARLDRVARYLGHLEQRLATLAGSIAEARATLDDIRRHLPEADGEPAP